MRSRIGAVAVAAAMLVVPGSALAGEQDPALVEFTLPSRLAMVEFESLGANMDHGMKTNEDGTVVVSAWVNDEQKALFRAHGFEPGATITDKDAIDEIRAERNRTLADLKAGREALRVNVAGRKGASAAPGSIRAQRADYYENNVGRFLSIEANVDGASYNGTTYVGPTVVAEWFDAAGNRVGPLPGPAPANVGVYRDPDVNPDYYQYHYSIFRIGNKGDGGVVPASIKVASSNGDVDTLTVKEWIAKDPPKPTAPLTGFVTHYNDSQEAYKKVRDLATEFPNISQAVKLPETTFGYQRRAQTMIGYQTNSYITFDAGNLPVAGAHTVDRQPSTNGRPELKNYGHQGSNSLTAQFLDPAANSAPLTVSLLGNAIRVSLATNATGAITSTAAEVAAAINAHPQVSTLVSATPFRTNAGAGVVQATGVHPLNDLLRAPASFPRGPQDQYMIRIGKVRDGSKVGVFLYCQEHGNEIATSGVCLETAERLVRNYGTDAQTTALVDNLDIFIMPMINGDGGTHSLYDSNRRTNLSNYCEDTVRFPSKETDPASRNSWGVDMNRNFQDGSVFDGFQGASATDCTSGNFAGLFEHSEAEVRNETWVQTTFRNIKFANNIHSSGGYFMWPPGAYKPTRETLPYPPYGTLNFFDQTAQDGPRRHQVPPRHGDHAAADRARHRRALLRGRQQRGRGLVQQQHHRLRLRDRNHQLLHQPGDRRRDDLRRRPAAAVRRLHEQLPRQRGLPRGHGVLPRQLRAVGGGDRLRQRHGGPGRLGDRKLGHQRRAGRPLHQQRGVVDLLHARRLDPDHGLHRVEAEPRPRAAAARRDQRRRDDQVDRRGLQGQHLRVGTKSFLIETDTADGDPHRVHRGPGLHAGPAGSGQLLLR